ncbi:hypothetical protein [Staphylococcus delphini]|nr:hypothetical protein [Staphylococcus delphini]PCF40312.1 hypothetical protein B5B99_03085 [Staphylococcus delphini]PCF54072.1 hypothetical protein B5C03_01005 [Staphylococcus delphini]PCF59249.1 hypothetical protein B5B97_01215 [Staphylococcus delphini]PCF60533.1 hypothetical protein B5C05_04005 [Staphylococcus delphini]PCF76992.1 hypothetical protein B4W73_03820 [Staphylococcus delphini]
MHEFDIWDKQRIDHITLTEFNYMMYALEYKYLKRKHELYELAFAIRDAQSTKNVGTEKKPKEQYNFKGVADILDLEKNYRRLNKGESMIFEQDDKPERPSVDILKQIQQINKGGGVKWQNTR